MKKNCKCFKPCYEIRLRKNWKIVEPTKKDGSYQLVLYHTSRPHLERDLEQILEAVNLLAKRRRKK